MALAWALSQVENGWQGTRLTNYAEYRALHPATWEVQIAENTSWSCAHGIDRWRADCGCNSGGKPGWRQQWRRPLREALDWLRERAVTIIDGIGGELLRDPWAARDAYIDVLLDRGDGARDRFLAVHAHHQLDAAQRVRALSVMEMARHAMLMFTSCGWFFDDLSGIETVQCMQYAARVAELIAQVSGADVEGELVDRLAGARSNIPDEGDGRQVWTARVRPARVGPEKICAHVAVRTLVDPEVAIDGVYGYSVEFVDRIDRRSGRARMAVGTVRVRSQLTELATTLCFAGIHLGEQHVTGGVREPPDAEAWTRIVDELAGALQTADVFAAQRAIDRHFPGAQLSLGALLPGSRMRVLTAVLGDAIAVAEQELGGVYDQHVPLIRWLVSRELPVPEVLYTTAEATLRRRVLANLRASEPSFAALRQHIIEALEIKVGLDTPEIALAASDALRRLIERLHGDGLDPTGLEIVSRAAEVASRMKSSVDLWFAQNATWRLLDRLPDLRTRAAGGDATAAGLAEDLERLAKALRLAVPSA
jgi:hypothetical protein